MKREVSLEEISDGKLYTANDMVKADCGDCKGCSACCRDMGTSIVLDPMDIYRMTGNLGKNFDELLKEQHIELNVADGIIFPNLKMAEDTLSCTFLNEQGRCMIHSFRPGICRLFPLGRYYENGDFSYFLQVGECRKENRTKVKVKKWIDTPGIREYEEFIRVWHNFLLHMEKRLEGAETTEATQINLFLLQNFYRNPYDPSADFYEQFQKRLNQARLMFP